MPLAKEFGGLYICKTGDVLAMETEERQTPYTIDEQRVVNWLHKKTPDIGPGNDPIGFLLASYDMIQDDKRYLRWLLSVIRQDLEDGTPDKALSFLRHQMGQ